MDGVVSDNSCSLATSLPQRSTIWFEGLVVRCLVSSLRILYGDELAMNVSHERTTSTSTKEQDFCDRRHEVGLRDAPVHFYVQSSTTDGLDKKVPNDDEDDHQRKCRGIIVTCVCSSEPR